MKHLVKHPAQQLLSLLLLLAVTAFVGNAASAQTPRSAWHAASASDLQTLLPARASVEKEHIETEMRTASGITDGHGKFVAGVVLITAGYAADGKYSHYLVVQQPITIGELALPIGEYVFGWQRTTDNQLDVKFYVAASGKYLGSVPAHRIPVTTRVESFRIWPPGDRQYIQIGRFGLPYELKD